MVNREGVYLAAASVLLIFVGVWAAVPSLEWELRRLLRARRMRRKGGNLYG